MRLLALHASVTVAALGGETPPDDLYEAWSGKSWVNLEALRASPQEHKPDLLDYLDTLAEPPAGEPA